MRNDSRYTPTNDIGVAILNLRIPKDLGWICREITKSDVGVDATIEQVIDTCKMQFKSQIPIIAETHIEAIRLAEHAMTGGYHMPIEINTLLQEVLDRKVDWHIKENELILEPYDKGRNIQVAS